MTGKGNYFVIHEHHARHTHFDLRLERDGVLKSWAVPKGIPEVPGEKHLAVAVEDHPLDYGHFEGTIPAGEYGAGTVSIWDNGTYDTKLWENDKIEITFHGKRLTGHYVLVPFKRAGKNEWLVFKTEDKRYSLRVLRKSAFLIIVGPVEIQERNKLLLLGAPAHSASAPAAQASPTIAITPRRFIKKPDKRGRQGDAPLGLHTPRGKRGVHPQKCRRELGNDRKKRIPIKSVVIFLSLNACSAAWRKKDRF